MSSQIKINQTSISHPNDIISKVLFWNLYDFIFVVETKKCFDIYNITQEDVGNGNSYYGEPDGIVKINAYRCKNVDELWK